MRAYIAGEGMQMDEYVVCLQYQHGLDTVFPLAHSEPRSEAKDSHIARLILDQTEQRHLHDSIQCGLSRGFKIVFEGSASSGKLKDYCY